VDNSSVLSHLFLLAVLKTDCDKQFVVKAPNVLRIKFVLEILIFSSLVPSWYLVLKAFFEMYSQKTSNVIILVSGFTTICILFYVIKYSFKSRSSLKSLVKHPVRMFFVLFSKESLKVNHTYDDRLYY
jgi:hypothetical protein